MSFPGIFRRLFANDGAGPLLRKEIIPFGTTSGTVCQGDDARLTSPRPPQGHKATHAAGGADALTPADIGAAAANHTTLAATTSAVGHVKLNSAVNSTSVTEAATPSAVKAAYDKAAAGGFLLCEFYFFRHPTLRPGFQPAQGGLLSNAATLYPEAWAYLQTTEGQKLCTTEEQWQAMTTATGATLADGSKVGWNGIGGAPYYAPNTATGALRLPDLRGMYAEAAGFDSLGVGGAHGDGMREIVGDFHPRPSVGGGVSVEILSGAFAFVAGGNSWGYCTAASGRANTAQHVSMRASRVAPVANKNAPRAWGSLACVYLGAPAS